jgi:outer membrane receptor protein involved in Fe transport
MLCAAVGALTIGAGRAQAQDLRFDIAPQSLTSALYEFGAKSTRQVMFTPGVTASKTTRGVSGETDEVAALEQLLKGTGLTYKAEGDVLVVVQLDEGGRGPQSQGAAGGGAEVEALIVTAQKREEDIQDVPIAISAFTQEQLERSQVAGGPDLMTQVPNMTFTKTNFSSYSIQIRGIGTQAISATTDAAVAVAFNNTPFIRNRFFEQEFYDLQRVEVLRGPQGTLYGRNATAGVVNLISQKPKFGYEAKFSGDVSNYNSTRLEGMINLPLVDDKVALRVAGAWTKREGYSTNEITGNPIDGRDLWSTRLSLRVAPTDGIDVNLIWEHFEEADDRIRSGKQLCHQDDRDYVGGLRVIGPGHEREDGFMGGLYTNIYSQGCLPASLYSPDSFQAPNGYSLPYFQGLTAIGVPILFGFNAYENLVQSPDLRVIESTVDPKYRAESDLAELQWSADVGGALTLTSETSYLYDTIFSSQDYNRFNTARGAFSFPTGRRDDYLTLGDHGWVFCDPQVGCADRLVAVDASRAKSSQFSQEFRLSSDWDGAFNFSLGANYLRYDTVEKYYVFINTLTMFGAMGGSGNFTPFEPWAPGVSDNSECFTKGMKYPDSTVLQQLEGCQYIDPNSIEDVNDLGHNYFLSKNPYKLISYAVFGEAYYNITPDLKVTAGLRWTVDKKEAPRIPSMLLVSGSVGLSTRSVERQEWREPTGRLTVDWKPDLPLTDETLLYASYAHGYKAGGSNPPPTSTLNAFGASFPGGVGNAILEQSVAKPKVFDPEFVDAFELGAKNTLLDGQLTLNAAAFYYDYKGYQISQIIDRSAVNYNFDSEVWGLEIEADWRPLENLRLGFKGGYQNTRIADGERAIDMMDRTAGRDDWLVLRPFPTYPSNCVLPAYIFDDGVTDDTFIRYPGEYTNGLPGPCEYAYALNLDPVTWMPYVPNPTLENYGGPLTGGNYGPIQPITAVGYPGFDPSFDYGNNHGEGFFKELGGNELPNAPHFTATITADYTVPLPSDWLMTLHTDLYYQSEAWTRVFNMEGYDKLKAYTNVNLAAIFTNDETGWKVMAYVKNIFDRDSITGSFLNSDDTGLTTNVFLTEPRLYGLRVTKEWSGGPWWTGANPSHTGPYPLTVELSGQVQRHEAPYGTILLPVAGEIATAPQHRDLDWGDGRQLRVTYRPEGGRWSIAAGVRYGRTNSGTSLVATKQPAGPARCAVPEGHSSASYCDPASPFAQYLVKTGTEWSDSFGREREEHVLADFAVGMDVGLGAIGDSRSTLSAGLRYADFQSTTAVVAHGINWDIPEGWAKYDSVRDEYDADLTADREFKGSGPTLSWEAAQHLISSPEVGYLDLEWSITGGVLFGKQKTTATGTYDVNQTEMKYTGTLYVLPEFAPRPLAAPRSKSVTVPMLDLSLGLSYDVGRFKAGAGYRWERYFDVLDVGYDEHQDADRTIDGPYFKIAVGFGG